MTEQPTEKFLWIFKVEDFSLWGSTPDVEPEDFAEYEFLNADVLMTREDAQNLLWDYECEHADTKGEPYFEDCDLCDGEGCNGCGHEGIWQEYYSEFVERHSNGKLAVYDPELHYTVPSDRPEHLKYAHEKEKEDLTTAINSYDSQLEAARKEMQLIGERIEQLKVSRLVDSFKLAKLENQ